MATSTTKSSPTPLPGRDLLEGELELGRVVGVFGVRGEVRLHLHNREGSVLLDGPYDVVLVLPDHSRRRARLSCRSGAGRRILGRIDGIADRDAAAALQGTVIGLARADLPEPDEGEFYVTDLQGLDVRLGDDVVGRVADVHNTDAGDLLELIVGDDVVFVAFSGPEVLDIDVPGGFIVLADGALDED